MARPDVTQSTSSPSGSSPSADVLQSGFQYHTPSLQSTFQLCRGVMCRTTSPSQDVHDRQDGPLPGERDSAAVPAQ